MLFFGWRKFLSGRLLTFSCRSGNQIWFTCLEHDGVSSWSICFVVFSVPSPSPLSVQLPVPFPSQDNQHLLPDDQTRYRTYYVHFFEYMGSIIWIIINSGYSHTIFFSQEYTLLPDSHQPDFWDFPNLPYTWP